MKKIGFIGLGVMGFPMAGHLQRAGYEVTVYNRTAAKAELWVNTFGGSRAATPADLAGNVDIVFSCVGNDNDLRQVISGPSGILNTVKPDTIVVDHTTASARVAVELSELLVDRRCHFLDAPVSGGQQGAENAALTVMVGGDEKIFTRVIPVLETMARSVQRLGPVGSGQLCKMVNQVCIAGLLQGLAEGLSFAERAGLDAQQVIDVISKGAAQSWQMENRSATMLAGEYQHGFAVDWMRKDLAIVLEEARSNGASLPVTALVDQFYADVQAAGGGRWDTSSLLTRLLPKQT
ncbi:NAD(P)-dependent oxidoreductase [Pseudomaricurvus alcaniphilus]|uniref:NAD(P)-dependent oxidoreductase n=1 Tax=Pseudomaricurvus alcaniphilus TaxID=1166482 RepID=UPI001408A1BC|nr:NAD(P)-dependent oxidoreductase [Pseudomaricurvus alcaniphilus]NHN39350.1 NAD(P)-dependent oxidoreductase [Pseudomaricurvus alcaniphilus]